MNPDRPPVEHPPDSRRLVGLHDPRSARNHPEIVGVPCEPFPVTRVYLELSPKKVFACALDRAGWCRIGNCEERAINPSPEGPR